MPLSVPLLLLTRGSDLNLVSGVYPGYCQPKPIAAVTSVRPLGGEQAARKEAP